jgi:predicted RNA binding protein YcfA (HicA-like mRNA interferase family)
MSKKLPVISGQMAVKAFVKAGWRFDRTSGSHVILRKEGSDKGRWYGRGRVLALFIK